MTGKGQVDQVRRVSSHADSVLTLSVSSNKIIILRYLNPPKVQIWRRLASFKFRTSVLRGKPSASQICSCEIMSMHYSYETQKKKHPTHPKRKIANNMLYIYNKEPVRKRCGNTEKIKSPKLFCTVPTMKIIWIINIFVRCHYNLPVIQLNL